MRVPCHVIYLFIVVFITACQPSQLQSFDFYVTNPGELEDAFEFCWINNNASKREHYCDVIKVYQSRYERIESDYAVQQSLHIEDSGFYPAIDSRANKALADAKRYFKMKKKGIKNKS